MKHKFYITAELKSVEETKDLRKEVSSVIDLPKAEERQPDLAYFSSRFVSTGTNLNYAHFLASELVKAGATVPGKAVDIEHEEEKIIGHIYKHAFTDKEGKYVDNKELSNTKDLDKQDLHIEIASVVYKTRFPEIVEEIQNGDWKVSMEAYFSDYDILVGNTILTKDEAQLMGFDLAKANELMGKNAKIVKAGKVVDEGKMARVLRGICFSGVGIVKNPANPPSIIFETVASVDDTDEIVLTCDEETPINVTYSSIDNDSVGTCVSYYKELNDSIVKDQDSTVIKENWCSKYDSSCPVYGEATNPNCLRFYFGDMVYVSASEIYSSYDINKAVLASVEEIYKTKELRDLLDRVEKLLV